MVIVVHVGRDRRNLLRPLLQTVKLLPFRRCFVFHVVELAPLNREVLLGVPLPLAVLLGFLSRHGLLLDLALKNFILLF